VVFKYFYTPEHIYCSIYIWTQLTKNLDTRPANAAE